MAQLDATGTPASAAEVLGALINSGVPSGNAATMLAAQSALETAGWTAMWNWNLGNITTLSGDFFLLGSDTAHRYKSYSSLSDGSDGFVTYLIQHGLLPYAVANDLAGYVARLKSFGYFESDAGPYQAGMAAWITRLGGVVPATSSLWKTLGICAAILAASGLTAFYILEGPAPIRRFVRSI